MEIALEQMLKELYQISGFRISVYDLDCHEIASYPHELSTFCACVQRNHAAKALCVNNDCAAFQKACQQGKPYIYRCQFGLYETVAPLYYFGTLSGYLMMGQILGNEPNEKEHVCTLAEPYCGNQEEVQTAVQQLPVCSREKLSSFLVIMSICAEYITLSNRFRPVYQNLAQSVKEYLKLHYHDKITLEDLCRRFYCSRATLTGAFRKEYGQTVMQYLTALRLHAAKEQLLFGKDSVAAIAAKCGFQDQNYFCKVFRKQEQMTPTQYQKQHAPVLPETEA